LSDVKDDRLPSPHDAAMKRSLALIQLSREHQHALALALAAKRAAVSGSADEVTAMAARLRATMAGELETHFRCEESNLLPLLAAAGHSGLVSRTLAEHRLLRQSAALIGPQRGRVLAFAELLQAHVRFEERELFQVCEEQARSRDGVAATVVAADQAAPAAVVRASGSRE